VVAMVSKARDLEPHSLLTVQWPDDLGMTGIKSCLRDKSSSQTIFTLSVT
jgi:hypothetical protein